jgi:N-acetylneuraminic acid mutarotase
LLKFQEVKANGNRVTKDKFLKVPKARSGHRIVTDADGNIYSFGGYNPRIPEEDDELVDDGDWMITRPLFRELWKFDITSKTWIKLQTNGHAPHQLASHSAAILNKHLLVFGGTGVPFGHSSSNSIHRCNLETLEWELVKAKNDNINDYPIEQYGQAIAVDENEGCLYVVGGTTGYRYTIDVHKFSFKTKCWTELYKKTYASYVFPEERYRHEVVLFNNKLHIFGGGTAESCFGFKEVPTFDLETRTWEALPTLGDKELSYPSPRRCHGCVQFESDIYIVGGTDGIYICNDMWRLDLISMQWTKLEVEIPLPVYFHGTSISPAGQLVIFGGVNSTTFNERNNSLYSLWLRTPPLKELSWLAFHYYSSSLVRQAPENLIEMGIPRSFVQRIGSQETTDQAGAAAPPARAY